MHVESVNNTINELESIDANSDQAYERIILALTKIKMLPILIYRFEEPFAIHRSRTHENDTFFKSFSEIGLVPNRYVTSFARCNRPGQSVFYCSENRPTSFMELVNSWVEKTKPGDEIFVTLGRWQIIKPFQVAIITTPDKEHRKDKFDIEHGSALDEFIGETKDKDQQESHIIFYRYMFEKFRMPGSLDPKTYLITTAYCNLIWAQKGEKIDGIYYPSVPFMSQGVNFAFKKDFIESDSLQLTHVIRNSFKVTAQDNGKHSFTEEKFSEAKKIDIQGSLIYWDD